MKPFLISCILLTCSMTLFSQKIQVKGIVIDSITHERIPYATVAIYNQTKLIDGVSTNENGIFQLKINKKFTHLEVRFIAYKTREISSSEIENQKELTIELTPETNALEEIVVKSERTLTQLKIDRKVINLGSDIQQAGTTVLEAFDQITDIHVDLSTGGLTLRGSGNVRLLIDGKPTSLNATELLEQIPSSSVDRIEIITSPSARQQANGLSGIINIILKKNNNKTSNLNANTSVGTKRYGFGLDGNYHYSFLNIRLNASLKEREMLSKQTLTRVFSNSNTENIYTPHDFDGTVKRIASGIDFTIDTKNKLSFDINYTENFHGLNNNSFYTNISNRDDYNYLRALKHFHITTTMNANYKHQFKTKEHTLDFTYHLNKGNNRMPASIYEDDLFLFNEANNYTNILQTSTIDYVLPIHKKATFETGFSWNHRDLKSIYNFEQANETPTLDRFDYTEEVVGIYALTKYTVGKISWQAGLRYEYFTSNSSNSQNLVVLHKTIPYLFPSLHTSYSIDDKNTLNLGYSKRVSRPNSRHINPFQLASSYFRFEGNPDLQPEYSDNIELNYQNTNDIFSWSAATFYRHKKNVIQRFDRIENNAVQVITYINSGTNDAYGFEASTHFKPTSFLSTTISGNYYITNLNIASMVTWNELYSSNIQLKNTVKFNNRFSADITYKHTFKEQQAFYFTEPRNRIDIAARAKFLKKKLTASLRIIDVLNVNLMKQNTITQGFTENEIWHFQSQTRGFLLSLAYKIFEKNTSTKIKNK